jgi:lipopolysaccharide biosynthesis protein
MDKYDLTEMDYRKAILDQLKEIEKLNNIIIDKDSNINDLVNKLNYEAHEKNRIINSRGYKLLKLVRKAIKYVMPKKFKRNTFLSASVNEKGEIVDPSYYKNFNPYDSEYQENINYENLKTDIKPIAFYLPQFHTFKENDEWWGKGFTEWTNTRKAEPRFEGHYQPRTPHKDIGFYDLSDINVMKKQVELAKQHGIYGFCFYYYWFSGKRLMEKPIDMVLNHPEIDFPFCLCWANENWTRTWDGQEKEVLIAQEYSKKDYKNFIIDIKKYISDERYIKIDGKPVILVYNPYQIPDIKEQFSEWRKYAREEGIGEIYIMARNNLADMDFERADIVDAEFDFSPIGLGHPASLMTGLPYKRVVNYKKLVDDIEHLYEQHFTLKPFYYSLMMAWDNSARRKDGFVLYNAYSLKSFYKWLNVIIKYTRLRHKPDSRFIFVNAWNEWAEGTYLEPDEKYGYANINTLSKAIFDLPFNNDVKVITPKIKKYNKFNKKIAVHIHLFYTDLIKEIINQLKLIPYDFDIYISTDANNKISEIKEAFYKEFNSDNVHVMKTVNRGRDVAPFLIQMSKVINKYDYVCHIHTKKSTTADYGDEWRKYLYYNLFGSTKNIKEIFDMFESNESAGLIFPETFSLISDMVAYGGNKNNLKKLSKKLNITIDFDNDKLVFPSGTMFWAKVSAIKPLFDLKLSPDDFEKENGQVDGTLAHAIERIFCFLILSNGYKYVKTLNRTDKLVSEGVKWYHL